MAFWTAASARDEPGFLGQKIFGFTPTPWRNRAGRTKVRHSKTEQLLHAGASICTVILDPPILHSGPRALLCDRRSYGLSLHGRMPHGEGLEVVIRAWAFPIVGSRTSCHDRPFHCGLVKASALHQSEACCAPYCPCGYMVRCVTLCYVLSSKYQDADSTEGIPAYSQHWKNMKNAPFSISICNLLHKH